MKQPLIEACFNYLNPRRYMGFRCLSHHMRAANAQTSLCIHAIARAFAALIHKTDVLI